MIRSLKKTICLVSCIFFSPPSISLQHAEEKAKEQEKLSEMTTSSATTGQKVRTGTKDASHKHKDEFKPKTGFVQIHLIREWKQKDLLCQINRQDSLCYLKQLSLCHNNLNLRFGVMSNLLSEPTCFNDHERLHDLTAITNKTDNLHLLIIIYNDQ